MRGDNLRVQLITRLVTKAWNNFEFSPLFPIFFSIFYPPFAFSLFLFLSLACSSIRRYIYLFIGIVIGGRKRIITKSFLVYTDVIVEGERVNWNKWNVRRTRHASKFLSLFSTRFYLSVEESLEWKFLVFERTQSKTKGMFRIFLPVCSSIRKKGIRFYLQLSMEERVEWKLFFVSTDVIVGGERDTNL